MKISSKKINTVPHLNSSKLNNGQFDLNFITYSPKESTYGPKLKNYTTMMVGVITSEDKQSFKSTNLPQFSIPKHQHFYFVFCVSTRSHYQEERTSICIIIMHISYRSHAISMDLLTMNSWIVIKTLCRWYISAILLPSGQDRTQNTQRKHTVSILSWFRCPQQRITIPSRIYKKPEDPNCESQGRRRHKNKQ